MKGHNAIWWLDGVFSLQPPRTENAYMCEYWIAYREATFIPSTQRSIDRHIPIPSGFWPHHSGTAITAYSECSSHVYWG